jgi:hypothetical protein
MKIQTTSIVCLAVILSACGGHGSPASANAPAPPPLPTYRGTFDKGSAENWTASYGNWWVKDGLYQQDDKGLENTKTMLSLPNSDCYTFQFKATTPTFCVGSLLVFVKYQKKYIAWRVGAASGVSSEVAGIDNPEETARPFTLEEKRWTRLKIIVNGERLVGWVDDAQTWSIRRQPGQVRGLDPAGLGKDLVGLVGFGTDHAHVQFGDVQVNPTCQ